jgi:glycerol-3-phosphate acyltransferase PlsY
MLIIPAILISYLLGSIPTAYIFGRLKGIDIRKSGSGNVGATNAMRVLGKGTGITVLFLDILKGFLATVLAGDFLVSRNTVFPPEAGRILLGIACICGHNWAVFLKFKGGKGVATTLGVLIGLALKIPGVSLILGLAVLTWLAVFLLGRIVSLASVLSGISLFIYSLIFKQSKIVILACLFFCALGILRHRTNLSRLLQGKEKRLF